MKVKGYYQVAEAECQEAGKIKLLHNESSHMFLVWVEDDSQEEGVEILTWPYHTLDEDEMRELYRRALHKMAEEAIKR